MRRLLKPQNIIILAFVLMVAGVLAASWANTLGNIIPRERAEVFCHIGSEKDNFLRNPEIQRILLDQYGLEVDFNRMGSIEQALLPESQLQGVDCLWPSNSSALEIFRIEHPGIDERSEIIFNSPIVLYTWDDVLAGLESSGYVEASIEGHYVVDMMGLAELMRQPRPMWEDLNVDRTGTFRVETTDPTRSNSGNMFYGLFLNMLAGGDIATQQDLETHLAEIEEYYSKQGFMEESSGILFDRYVSQGSGAYPLIANYESLIIELSIANPNLIDQIRQNIRIVYPEPTVYSSHPLIALTETGQRLLEALKDPEIQRIAWEQHGFRTAIPTITNDPSVLAIADIPARITQVLNLPRPEAMLNMVEALQTQ